MTTLPHRRRVIPGGEGSLPDRAARRARALATFLNTAKGSQLRPLLAVGGNIRNPFPCVWLAVSYDYGPRGGVAGYCADFLTRREAAQEHPPGRYLTAIPMTDTTHQETAARILEAILAAYRQDRAILDAFEPAEAVKEEDAP